MSETKDAAAPAAAGAFKPKKSVALSGVTAGNTALCTVGKTGNDLHYRGYDILDVAESCEFEEIAHLLVHGTLPNLTELAAYKTKLRALRGLPSALKAALEQIPASAHPMDVMRTGVSVLGTVLPEKDDHNLPGARDIADRLMASLGSMLLYWYHFSHNGKRIETETDDDSIGGHFLHLLHGKTPSKSWVEAMHTSLILYAEHEFNASTFTGRVIAGTGSDIYSAITGAIGALRGPKHGGANEVAYEIQSRYSSPDDAEADIRRRVENKEVVIGFGHPVYTISDPRNKVIKGVAHKLSKEAGDLKLYDIAERNASACASIGGSSFFFGFGYCSRHASTSPAGTPACSRHHASRSSSAPKVSVGGSLPRQYSVFAKSRLNVSGGAGIRQSIATEGCVFLMTRSYLTTMPVDKRRSDF